MAIQGAIVRLLPALAGASGLQRGVRAEFEARLGVAIVITLAVVLVAALLTMLIRASQRARCQRRLPIEIRNLGNVPGRYELRADDADAALRFRWLLEGEALQAEPARPASGDSRPSPAQDEALRSEPRGEGPVGPRKERPAPSSAAEGVDRARQGAERASRLGSVLAGALASLARIVPGAPGAWLRQASSRVRRSEYALSRAVRAPSRITSRLPARARGRVWARVRASFKRASVRGAAAVPAAAAPRSAAGALRVGQQGQAWSRTPPLEPGGALTVELLVDPLRPFQAQRRTVRVWSRSAELGDAPLVTAEQPLALPGIPWSRRVLPLLLVYLAGAVVVSVIFWLASAGGLGW
jgi:hypothetical protein